MEIIIALATFALFLISFLVALLCELGAAKAKCEHGKSRLLKARTFFYLLAAASFAVFFGAMLRLALQLSH